MTAEEIDGLVSHIGVVIQLLGSVLQTALFYMLHRYARRRIYFTVWGWAWAALSVAIAALALRYDLVSAPEAAVPAESPVVRGLDFIYQWAKVLFSGLLVVGTLLYARGLKHDLRMVAAALVAAAAGYALLSTRVAPDLNDVMFLQAPVAMLAFGFCSARLLGLSPSRSSFGSKRTGFLFGVIAATWTFYLWGFSRVAQPTADLTQHWLALLLGYNSYVDLLLQMVLGYGMVVMLMEDANREVDDARHRLEVAHDRLKRDSLYDPLTGALNRRAFAEGVGLDMARATFGSVVVLDMDNLKEVNDVHGHAAGDAMLRHLGEVLRARLRASDGLYRWGGDEFLLVLPGSRPAEAQRLAETTLARAGELPVGEGRIAVRLSVSAGSASYVGGEDLHRAIETADREMYRQKTFRKSHSRGASAGARAPSPRELEEDHALEARTG